MTSNKEIFNESHAYEHEQLHSHSGDKGDTANVGLIFLREDVYALRRFLRLHIQRHPDWRATAKAACIVLPPMSIAFRAVSPLPGKAFIGPDTLPSLPSARDANAVLRA